MANEHIAQARGVNLPISFKDSIEIGRYLRRRKVSTAKGILESVMEKKQAIPFKVYNKDRGHKTGIGPGKYPVKAAMEINAILKSAESNAQNKGMDTASLVIQKFVPNKGATQWRFGRRRRRQAKRTHILIVLEEADKPAKGKQKKPLVAKK